MAVVGLSSDVEVALINLIEGLEYSTNIDDVESKDLKAAVEGKVEGFNSSKKLFDKWINSPNAPSQKKVLKYSKSLVKAGKDAQKFMRLLLAKKMNYDDIEAKDMRAVAKAKPYIYQSIVELNSGIVELEMQIDANKINYAEKEFKIGWPERVAKGEVIDLSTLHKDWYNEKHQAIKICPRGTEGEIIEVGELKIQLPEVPASKKNILFSEKHVTEQYWQRVEMPKGLTQETEEEYVDYIAEEFRRRIHGVWFMNKGKPVYLTGHMYFWLQWYADADGEESLYSQFRFAQLYLSYHTKACEVDKRCLGQLFLKSRRTGFTLEKLARKLNIETITTNLYSGLTSKSETDAEKTFGRKQYAYSSLPFFFKPVVQGSSDSNKYIKFGKPANNTKEAKKRKDKDIGDYLNTQSDIRPTVERAYDSTKLNDYLADEAFKWPTRSKFLSHWSYVSPTMDENGIIVGKAWIGSTMGAHDEGGAAGLALWKDSNPHQRNKLTGRTGTGLYRYFMPVQENTAICTDKYGICHIKKPRGNAVNRNGDIIPYGALDYWKELAKEEAKKGVEALNNFKREHPTNLEEALLDKLEDASLNSINIQEQLEFVRNNEGLTRRGYFAWKNGQPDTEVIWVPDPNGRFEIAWLPPKELRNKFMWKGSQRAPLNTWLGAGGLDPFSGKSVTTDNRQSKGSFHFINRNNLNHPETNNMFVLQYIYRPLTVNQFYEDALMSAVFYGYEIFYESDHAGIETYFDERGYGKYLMLRPKRYQPKRTRKVNERGAPSRGQMIEHVYYALQAYTNNHIGYNDLGRAGNMYFKETLKDWLHFEPDNRTAYDASISTGYALCAIQADPPKTKNKNKDTPLPFRKYKIQGNTPVNVKG